MVLITIVTGAYKPTYTWGASHCMLIYIYIICYPSEDTWDQQWDQRWDHTWEMALALRTGVFDKGNGMIFQIEKQL